jgi:hypothetical protein
VTAIYSARKGTVVPAAMSFGPYTDHVILPCYGFVWIVRDFDMDLYESMESCGRLFMTSWQTSDIEAIYTKGFQLYIYHRSS